MVHVPECNSNRSVVVTVPFRASFSALIPVLRPIRVLFSAEQFCGALFVALKQDEGISCHPSKGAKASIPKNLTC